MRSALKAHRLLISMQRTFCVAGLVLYCFLRGKTSPTEAVGPLQVHPTHPRYFTNGTKNPDGSLKAIYRTGSHHRHNLQDAARIGRPLTKIFDYDGYLEHLASFNHNFMRKWSWEGGASGNSVRLGVV